MSDEELFRWSKSVADDALEWWETELVAADVAYVVEKAANRKRWRLAVYDADRGAMETLKARFGGGVSRVRPEDWQHQAVDEAVPLKIRDRFVVTQHGDPVALEKIAGEFPDRGILSFPPRLAFGTGGHPTTAGCLRLLVDAARNLESPWPMLDLGCGSGILAIAAAKMGASPAVALEFDPAAMAVARENAVRHGVEDHLEYVEGDAVAWVSKDSRGATYPIIAANLFSELLIAILPHLPKWLPPDGTVILSGFLTSQAKDVNAAAVAAGITLDRFVRRGKWVAAAGSLA